MAAPTAPTRGEAVDVYGQLSDRARAFFGDLEFATLGLPLGQLDEWATKDAAAFALNILVFAGFCVLSSGSGYHWQKCHVFGIFRQLFRQTFDATGSIFAEYISHRFRIFLD